MITKSSCCSIQGRAFDLKSPARVLIKLKAFSFQSNKNDNYMHSKNQFWLRCALVSCMQFTFWFILVISTLWRWICGLHSSSDCTSRTCIIQYHTCDGPPCNIHVYPLASFIYIYIFFFVHGDLSTYYTCGLSAIIVF